MAGPIQGDINSTIGTLGVLAGLSGIPQARAAKKAEVKEQQRLDKQAEVTSMAVNQAAKHIDIENPMIPENDAYIDALKNAESARKAQFERNPSESTYGEYQTAFMKRAGASADLENARKQWQEEWDDLVSKQKQAMADMESKKQARKTQKRNFMAYLAQSPTSLGGTVGDLPYDLQKKIASQYSRNDRRTMMDRMDREANDGKQK